MTVYDCFSFHNELDLLEIRLNELDSVVDYFVLTESPITFSNVEKILYFNEHKEESRFKKFEYKIIHQILTDIPDDYVNLTTDGAKDELHRIVLDKVIHSGHWPHTHAPYGRDAFTKESALRPLIDCEPEDMIMYSDVDEIPNVDTIRYIRNNFDSTQISNLCNTMYYYYINCLKEDNWVGTTVTSFKNFKKLSVADLRTHRRGPYFAGGGWHFSYLGGTEKILEKMISGNEDMMHVKSTQDNIQNSVNNCLTSGVDLYGRPCKFTKVEIDNSYPKYIKENIEKFRGYIMA